MQRSIQLFEVSLKAAIACGDRLLMVQEADTGFWELPGGRIEVGEEASAHSDILARELTEELGPAIRIETQPEVLSLIRTRPSDGQHIFLILRLCRYLGGNISLSPEHSDYRWVGLGEIGELSFPPASAYLESVRSLFDLLGKKTVICRGH